jgi:hypothetical protein
MQRAFLDRIVSWIGLGLTAILIVAASLLTWANHFVSNEVKTQLSAQQIYFPPKGSPATAGPEFAQMRQYAGQQLTTGAQAETYADHFIAVHLKEVANGQTYAQLSTKAQLHPTDTKLAGQVNTMFKGETLRGLLLNAYAFGTMGTIAGIAAVVAFVAAALMLMLSALGLWHGRRTPSTQTVFAPSAPRSPAVVG